MAVMSDSARRDEIDHGAALLLADLTDVELASTPVLASLADLLIDDLSDAEDDTFASALGR